MKIHLSPGEGEPLYLQLMRQIQVLVGTGKLEAGEQLPPVRKLAEQLVINPNTVARAYRELEGEGVVVARRGAGVFVADGPSPLSRRERNRRLNQRVDALIAEALQWDVSVDELVERVRSRGHKFPQERTS